MNGFSIDLSELREATRHLADTADRLASGADLGEPVRAEDIGTIELTTALNEFRATSRTASTVLRADIDAVADRLRDTEAAYRTMDGTAARSFGAIGFAIE